MIFLILKLSRGECRAKFTRQQRFIIIKLLKMKRILNNNFMNVSGIQLDLELECNKMRKVD